MSTFQWQEKISDVISSASVEADMPMEVGAQSVARSTT